MLSPRSPSPHGAMHATLTLLLRHKHPDTGYAGSDTAAIHRHRHRRAGSGMARSLLGDAVLFCAGATVATVLLLTLASPFSPPPAAHVADEPSPSSSARGGGRTFYDDPEVTYTMDRPITRWDQKRAEWLRAHPELANADERVLMVSGSQPTPCRAPAGDHLLTRLLKNKADYCRLNGLQLLYNTALLRPSMDRYWAKIPLVRAAMVAHPDAEWVWWVDSDAVLTDMDFRLPLPRYAGRNLVVHGWPSLVYGSGHDRPPTWTGLNAGVFLIRNCQWSLDFMAAWAAMGPDSPDYQRWGAVLTATFKDKVFNESDDQSALVYMLMHNDSPWRDKVFLEDSFYFEGYWLEIVPRLGNITARYEEMERRAPELRRGHAVREHAERAAARNAALEAAGLGRSGVEGWRRPFITHFTGCQPCSGDRNRDYAGDSCDDGMRRALNFADDQVLRSYGFRHADPLSDDVRPLPFDYPAAAARQ
ncbi:probable glycosyltransferase 7 [Lolium perenne]|uniref:probable glycosyltransferase 7 n=1 Tax=Lolium perenne TaxID=4522 RepID=UPI0021F61B37|nr:probable glycosyltransferase 7 [Lolium perenne]